MAMWAPHEDILHFELKNGFLTCLSYFYTFITCLTNIKVSIFSIHCI